MHWQEALQLTGRFVSAHHLLSDPGGLVRVLRSVVQPLVLTALESQPHIPIGSCIPFELVSHHDPCRLAVVSQQLAHEPLGSLGIAHASYEHVQNVATLIHCTP